MCRKTGLRYFLRVYFISFIKFGRLVLYYNIYALYDMANIKFITKKIDQKNTNNILLQLALQIYKNKLNIYYSYLYIIYNLT